MAGNNVVQITDANFDQEVIKSATPVLVDFWAEWCGPCKRLGPTIEKLAADYAGRVKVGKLDTDANHATASKFADQRHSHGAAVQRGTDHAEVRGSSRREGFSRSAGRGDLIRDVPGRIIAALMPQLTIQQAFDLALQHHRAGRLQEAENLYRQILVHQPKHAEAMHLLGVIAHQVGRKDIAEDLIRQAIAMRPDDSGAYINLGNALRDMGRFDEAIAAYNQALALNPNLPEAHNDLGIAQPGKENLMQPSRLIAKRLLSIRISLRATVISALR